MKHPSQPRIPNPAHRPALLALALCAALAGGAQAQERPTPEQQRELDAARAELEQASKRYAELARKYQARDAFRIERKPLLGVLLAEDSGTGVRIAGVTPDSGAAEAGLKSGDRITSVDGVPLKAATPAARVAELRERLAKLQEGRAVQIGYERDGKPANASVVPRLDQRLFAFSGGNGGPGLGDVDFTLQRIGGKGEDIAALLAGVAPELRTELKRIGQPCDDRENDCKLQVLAETFRWSGLNLASVDAQLGRYFGTDKGVLVLTTGRELPGLQPGDVIQAIAGKPVASPREAMEALRAASADGEASVDYLRDRKPSTTRLPVPAKSLPFTLRMEPAQGSGGRKLRFIGNSDESPEALARALAEEGGKSGRRKIVVVDKDGQRHEWEGGPGETPPGWANAPADGMRKVEVIRQELRQRAD